MVGLQAAAQAIGLAAGPAIGGVLLAATGSWRWLFLVNVPFGVVGIATAATLLPRTRDLVPGRQRAGSLGRFLFGVLRAPRLVPTLLASLGGYALVFGTLVAIPLYLHKAGASTAVAGLIAATLPVAMGVVAPIAGHVSDRAPRRVANAGLALAVVSLLVIAFGHPAGFRLVAALVSVGFGLGAFIPANNRAVMIAAPPGASSTAAGLLNMMRGLGTAAGTAVAVMLLA
jgi:MFS family permease